MRLSEKGLASAWGSEQQTSQPRGNFWLTSSNGPPIFPLSPLKGVLSEDTRKKQITFVVPGTLPVCQPEKVIRACSNFNFHAKVHFMTEAHESLKKSERIFRNPFGNLPGTVSTCPIIPPSSPLGVE